MQKPDCAGRRVTPDRARRMCSFGAERDGAMRLYERVQEAIGRGRRSQAGRCGVGALDVRNVDETLSVQGRRRRRGLQSRRLARLGRQPLPRYRLAGPASAAVCVWRQAGQGRRCASSHLFRNLPPPISTMRWPWISSASSLHPDRSSSSLVYSIIP